MAAEVSRPLVIDEPSVAPEPFALANKKQFPAKAAEAMPKTHTLSARLSAPPPNVIVARPVAVQSTSSPETTTATTTSRDRQGASTMLEAPRPSPIRQVVRLPDPTPLDYSFDVRQRWEGVVASVGPDEFTVVLRDIVRADAPEYEAVLSIEEVPPDDLSLLKEGAVLYWTIGYKTMRTGALERVSSIRLRRLPAWSPAEVERVKKAAHDLDELFKSE